VKVNAFGYVVFESPDPSAWATFADDFMGAHVTEHGDAVAIRFDERHFRILIERGEAFGLARAGWEVRNRTEFEAGLERLAAADVKYEQLTRQECDERHIEEGIRLSDPLGTGTEVYFGGHGLCEPMSLRFGIESMQLGHLVFGTESQEAVFERFYVETLGMKVSDYLEFPYGSETLRATFLRAGDGRHHSLAFADLGSGLEHMAVTVANLDDVGRAWDRAHASGLPIVENLGRHSNSLEVSFYVVGPDECQLEYGTGPLVITDDDSWVVRRLDSGSLWGHRVDDELTNLH
jgi:3,4-dihydroxy-9,10-secoandrosta-1,3,5(10)-triene-9,17-dione 4,5-dioxygenase